MHLDPHVAVPATHLDRLVDERHGRADRHQREQMRHVLGVELRAAVAHLTADPPGEVRPMDAIQGPVQLETVGAERVVGVSARNRAPPVSALAQALAPDPLRDMPGRPFRFARDAKRSGRRRVLVAPEPDGQGPYPDRVRRRPGLEEPEAHLGDIQDEPLVPATREHEGRGEQHAAPRRREPRVHPGVGRDDLLVAESVEPGQIEEGVARANDDGAQLADDRIGRRLGSRPRDDPAREGFSPEERLVVPWRRLERRAA